MTAIQRFAIHGTIMNPHSNGPYVRHQDHLAAMQGRCLAQIEEPAEAAPAAVAPQGIKFFNAGTEGLEEHDTAEAAQAAAQEEIDIYREEAADGWPEEVDSVCWGVILGKAVEKPVQDAQFMAGIAGSDMEPVDYVLEPVAAPALEAPAAPMHAMPWVGSRQPQESVFTWCRRNSDAVYWLMDNHASIRSMLAAAPQAPAAPSARAVQGVAQFSKKPVVISAIQWTGKNLREVITFTDGPPDTRSTHAGMAWEAYGDLVARDGLKIYTLEGKMLANVGDWIIRGVKGEHYPCKPDIFAETYEVAAAPAAPFVQLHPARAGRIYVAGPMTGLPDHNFPAFNRAAAALRANGWHVENPAEHGVVAGAEWADYLHYDLGRLSTCSAVHLLPGWSKSRGAALEVHVATTLGMAVFYADGAEHVANVAAPAAPAVDAFTHAELLEIQRAVSEFEDCNETDVDYDLLMRAARAGYLECSQYFHVADKSKLDSDTAAAQAKEGGA